MLFAHQNALTFAPPYTAAASYRQIKPRPWPDSPAQVDVGPSARYALRMSRASQARCNLSTVGASMLSWCTDLVWIADLANLYVG